MPETIEAEVIEINGEAPTADSGTGSAIGTRRVSGTRSFALRLDRRWWPLWTLMGALGVALLLTVGVVLAIAYLTFALVRGVFRALGGYPDSRQDV